MVGALRPQKDPLTFVRACAIVHRRFPEVVFELCGAGELEESVQGEVVKLGLSETFTCRGHVEPILERLRHWDIFALSSRFEGLPYALLEAMAMGKPVVAARVSGVEEIIVSGREGILVSAHDPGAMADALAVLVESESMRAAMGQAGADRVALLYTKDRQLAELEAFYLGVCGEPRYGVSSNR
jgi:glycosyltransferase involved in cell wall biosynthesis